MNTFTSRGKKSLPKKQEHPSSKQSSKVNLPFTESTNSNIAQFMDRLSSEVYKQ